MRTFVVGCAFLCCALPSAEARDCVVPGFNGVDNGTAVGHMTVRAGRRCAVSRLGGDGVMIRSTRIVSPPRAGRVGLTPTAVTYRPMPGYVGADVFAFQNQGR